MKLKYYLAYLTLTAILLLSVGVALGADVTLKWDANTEADLAGYKLYHGTMSRTDPFSQPPFYNSPYDVGNETVFTIRNLQEGVKYYFAVTAYDVTGNESGYSNEVSTMFIDMTPPGVPQQFRIHLLVQ